MLPLLLLLLTVTAYARPFNITSLLVPEVVLSGEREVEIECRYDANFTLLNWFKGSKEFFRYRPGAAPSTRSFPILGVGTVEMVTCGPTACRLRLGALTDEASGQYMCNIERDVPPYKFETRSAHMEVRGHGHRNPLLTGLGEVYGEGDVIQAYCRGLQDSEFRWYLNGEELMSMRGSESLRKNSSRLLFPGIPPVLTVQCAEFRQGSIFSSKQMKARWNEIEQLRENSMGAGFNNANIVNGSYNKFCVFLFVLASLCLVK